MSKIVFLYDRISLSFHFCCPFCFVLVENYVETITNVHIWCYNCKNIPLCFGSGIYSDFLRISFFENEKELFYSNCIKKINKIHLFSYFFNLLFQKKGNEELNITFSEFQNFLNADPNNFIIFQTSFLPINSKKRKRMFFSEEERNNTLFCYQCFNKYKLQ